MPADLQNSADAIRRTLIEMHFRANAGHLGSSLSALETLVAIYGAWKRTQDFFILSKGHAASVLYATLHHFKQMSEAEFKTYYQDGTLLPAHPAALGVSAITAATGSLGHGLPIAAGLAYSHAKLRKSDSRFACLVSDGECNEGAIWEAAMFISHHALTNLTVIVDANGWQGFGATSEVLNMEPFQDKWKAFGFDVSQVDGHNLDALVSALNQTSTQPRCIIAKTIKGHKVPCFEGTLQSHYLPLTQAQFEEALASLQTKS